MSETRSAMINGVSYSEANLEKLPRDPDLRNLARWVQEHERSNVSRSWIGSMASKSDLIQFLLGGKAGHEVASTNGANGHSAESQLASAIAAIARANTGVDPGRVEQICNDLLDVERCKTEKTLAKLKGEFDKALANSVKTVEVKRWDGITVKVGVAHKTYPKLLKRVEAALADGAPAPARNMWLIGPAGAGKTYAVEQIAKALGLDFAFNGAIDTEYKLLGFTDANGHIVSRPFRRIYANGGIYLFDELDGSMPSACLALNAALANGQCDFPDEMVKRHASCVIIASGNVWNGATDQFVARFKPDAAFANRFGVKMRWDYDEALESALCADDKWVGFVQKCRANALRHGVQHIISPRASETGAHLLRCGTPWEECVEECVRQGLSDDKWRLVHNG